MNESTVNAAQAILAIVTNNGSSEFQIKPYLKETGVSEWAFELGMKLLEYERFIKVSKGFGYTYYHLTKEGGQFKNRGVSLQQYLEEKDNEQSIAKQMKELQIEFWRSGIERDKLQRQHFILTVMIASAAFILSVLTFVKAILFP